MVSIIRQEADEIRFMEEELPDLTKIKTVKKIFDRLVQDVLNKIKGEDKRKTLMVMLFNKVDRNQVEKLIKRKNKTSAV
jgi:DNA replicative helicase MCM subunit Mcm2 (Cdc46/Mcm family)